MDSYLEQYHQQGFFIIKNLIDQEKVELAFREIISSNETQVYHDRNGAVRRIERIYDKGPNLIDINNIFLEELSSIFGEEFCIFKDKFNAKPPQGEGFYAHYDGIFSRSRRTQAGRAACGLEHSHEEASFFRKGASPDARRLVHQSVSPLVLRRSEAELVLLPPPPGSSISGSQSCGRQGRPPPRD